VKIVPPARSNGKLMLGLFGHPPQARDCISLNHADEAATSKICELVRSGIDGLALWFASTKVAGNAA